MEEGCSRFAAARTALSIEERVINKDAGWLSAGASRWNSAAGRSEVLCARSNISTGDARLTGRQ